MEKSLQDMAKLNLPLYRKIVAGKEQGKEK